MNQKDLFGEFERQLLARPSDPETSHIAAADLVQTGTLPECKKWFLDALGRCESEGATSNEVARFAQRLGAKLSAESIRKRSTELARAGLIEKVKPMRRCTVTRKFATVWRLKK